MKTRYIALTGLFVALLLVAIGVGTQMSKEPNLPTPTTSTPRTQPIPVAVAAAKPIPAAAPVGALEASLNAQGLSLVGGIRVSAGYKTEQKGGSSK